MGGREFEPLWKIQGWENSGIYEVTPYHLAFTGIFRNYPACSGIFWLFRKIILSYINLIVNLLLL